MPQHHYFSDNSPSAKIVILWPETDHWYGKEKESHKLCIKNSKVHRYSSRVCKSGQFVYIVFTLKLHHPASCTQTCRYCAENGIIQNVSGGPVVVPFHQQMCRRVCRETVQQQMAYSQ